MPDDDPLRTSLNLLGRLRRDPKDRAAWSEFVARHGPRILQGCRGWGLQECDAHDVTQDVLMKLNGLMARFVYDPSGSFRGWLKTLTHHAWRDLAAERRRSGLGVGERNLSELLSNLQAGENLAEQLDAEFRREVIDRAMERIRRRGADVGRLPPDGAGEPVGSDRRRAAGDEGRAGVRGQKRSEGDDPGRAPQTGGVGLTHCPARDRLKRLLEAPCADDAGEELVRHLEG
jgi:RNA polymerase sigma-70 factor (ECF subfamily)